MTQAISSGRSIDDYLGSSDKRFFSAGYRRVDYRFGEVSVTAGAGPAELNTAVSLSYPGNWSKKATGDLRPHLSTIDAILLGVAASEAYLLHTTAPGAEDRRRMWVSRVRIRAAASPDEQLEQVPLRARLRATHDRPGLPGVVSELEVRVGGMRIIVDVVHPGHFPDGNPAEASATAATARGVYRDLEELAGPAAARYYGAGFKRRSHRITDPVIDLEARTATAAVHLSDEETVVDRGIEGGYPSSATMVDCFATSLQLAQILLYELDGMKRSMSNTLWMRSTDLRVRDAARPPVSASGLPLTCALEGLGLTEMGGGRWRTTDIVSHLAGVDLRCAVAHRLPS